VHFLVPIKLAHDFCGSMREGLTPKQFDDTGRAVIPENMGKRVTKSAITHYCPQYLPLEYW
jgi:hypothetical protein